MTGRSRKLAILVFAVLATVGMAAACTPDPGTGNNQPPVAVANAFPGFTSMEIVFSPSGSFDPDGTIVGYLWDFGDGSATSTQANPTHTFAQERTYTATLTVTDSLGAARSAQVSVTLPVTPNRPPVAVGTASPPEGPTPLTVQFSSAGSTDPDDQIIASYLWNFGDGITSTDANPEHRYAGLGNFAATLTVTDRSGATNTVAVPVAAWEAELLNSAHGRCMDVSHASTANGTKALSYPCTGEPNQRWVLENNGRISTGLSASKCLDAQDNGALGANVGIYDCNGSLYQRWAFVDGTLVNDQSGYCLAAEFGSVVPGTELVLATCNPADPAQQWHVAKWQERPKQRVRNTAIDRCLGTAGNGLSNGRAVVDWTCNTDIALGWYLDPNGLLINRAGASWCMDGNGGALGAQVLMRQCAQGQSWQRWTVSGGQLVNGTNNACLTRSSATDLPGSTMVLAACDGANLNQKFAVEDEVEWEWQQIRNTASGACAGIANTGNGTTLQTKPCDQNDGGQSWHLDGGGRLHPRANQGNTGRCVDGNNGGNVGSTVIVWDCNTQPWQRWSADAGAQTLVNNANHLCVEAAGTALKLQACNGTDAQRWVVEPRP